ncbi:SgcJ/EcaC family oxidoreductase [Nocardioides sp.]|uniref:SgcJ/EcaC family oxidoreductase n=1 Tax=Nocardioides sp. TaxID=35761 RepID=UPI002ED3E791
MTTTHGAPSDTDVQAITGVVATLQHAQQNESVDEFVSLFREDAIWTTGGGRFLDGRAQIEAFTRTVLPGAMAESTQTYEVVHVVFIRPDVAAVKVRQRYTTVDGVPIEGAAEGSPTYVMAKEDGRWLLVVAQNTLVADG